MSDTYYSIPRIDLLQEPPKVGSLYLVPVFIEHGNKGRKIIRPLLFPIHSDVENGQKESHYHIDSRFIDWERTAKSKHSWTDLNRVNPRDFYGFKIEWHPLRCYSDTVDRGGTHVGHIAKSKIKHPCIYKGKCGHRGYNLEQVIPKDGVITCPLHGLQYDAITKKLINNGH